MQESRIQKIKIEKLQFDSNNPRIDTGTGQKRSRKEIVRELLSEGIDDLIDSILRRGIAQGSIFYVIREENQYVVIDGNRRLLTFQLINGQFQKQLGSYPNLRKKLENIRKKYGKVISVNAIIFSTREGAEREMAILHLSGEPVRKWKLIRQYRYFYKKIIKERIPSKKLSDDLGIPEAKIKKGVVLYQLYEIGKKNLATQIDVFNDHNFLMDKFERFVYSQKRRKFLGYQISNNLTLTYNNFHEFLNKLLYILKIVHDPDTPAQIKSEEIDHFLNKYQQRQLPVFSSRTADFNYSTNKNPEIMGNVRRRLTRRRPKKLPILFGERLILKKGVVNDIYRDIMDLYYFYIQNKDNLSKTFVGLIRMSLRLLVEAAQNDTQIQSMNDYIKKYFDQAKKQLSKDQRTTLNANEIKKSNLVKLLHIGAHNYESSTNFEQLIAISLIIGQIIKITHGRD